MEQSKRKQKEIQQKMEQSKRKQKEIQQLKYKNELLCKQISVADSRLKVQYVYSYTDPHVVVIIYIVMFAYNVLAKEK